MLMIEGEARAKWCPHARCLQVTDEGITAANRGDSVVTNPKTARCIARDCMAWRWEDRRDPGREDRGYCGLAGKVEG